MVYSSAGITQIADIYVFDITGIFKNLASLQGIGEGPEVSNERGGTLMVDYQRAMIKNGDVFQIYYGRPYRWNGQEFLRDKDGFLDLVQTYDPVHSLHAGSVKDLKFFENYATSHPDDFCALADCFDFSRRLGRKDKAALYRSKLLGLKVHPLTDAYGDEWTEGKNQVAQQLYLEWVSSMGQH